MGKIGQNPKIGQLWRPVAPQPYVVQKKVDESSETPWSKQYLSPVHPLTCSLLWVGCLFDPLQVWGFGANDPWMESFRKYLSKICVSTAIHVSWQFGENRPLRSCRKVISVAYKKNSGVGDTFELPVSAPLNRSRPKFRERCRPLTCACVLTLVQIGFGLPDLFWQESKKWIQYRLSAYKKHSLPTASLLCHHRIGDEKMAYIHK